MKNLQMRSRNLIQLFLIWLVCHATCLASDRLGPKTVESLSELRQAVSLAEPGDIIELVDGDYEEGPLTLAAKGTDQKSVIVRSQTIGGVTLHHPVTIDGEYITMTGFNMVAKAGVTIKGRGCRLTQCKMSNVQSGKWITVESSSRNVEIDHCLFEDKQINTRMEFGCQLIQIVVLNKNEKHHIHDNHFRDVPRGNSSNGFETLQLITLGNPFDPPLGQCGTIIERNLFERCNGESEIVSIKSNSNIIRENTFRACQGSLVLRHGHRNIVSTNRFYGDGESRSGGVRLQGKDQVVTNNYFHGLGDFGVSMMEGTDDKLYVAIKRCRVEFNTFVNCRVGLLVGLRNSNYSDGMTPENCVVIGNRFRTESGSGTGYFNDVAFDGSERVITFVNDRRPKHWRWFANVNQGDLDTVIFNWKDLRFFQVPEAPFDPF